MQREHYDNDNGRFISELFQEDRARLIPLPSVPFDTALYTTAATDSLLNLYRRTYADVPLLPPLDNNASIPKQKKYQHLQESYQEMNDYLLNLIREHVCILEEKRYMNDFIHYKNLDEEFSYFKEHAHEETETELPFPYLVL